MNKTKTFISNLLIIVVTGCFFNIALASNDDELGPWSAMFYAGETANEVFIHAVTGRFTRFGETIYAAELAYTLDKNNPFRRFLSPVFDVVEMAGNVAYRHDRAHKDNVKEGNLYLVLRFTRFPWSKYLRNSIAIGDGISYSSHVPFAERVKNVPLSNHSKFLNYLMMEITFALPKHPNLQLLIRTHHTCTAWGTFPGKANVGSTNVGLGIRYYF